MSKVIIAKNAAVGAVKKAAPHVAGAAKKVAPQAVGAAKNAVRNGTVLLPNANGIVQFVGNVQQKRINRKAALHNQAIDELNDAKELQEKGLITEEDYEKLKRKALKKF